MSTLHGDALRGHLEVMVLSLLESQQAHGFEMMKLFEEAGSGALRLKEGTLYPVLYRLERAGLVRGAWDQRTESRRGPRRRVYRLTRRGKRRLGEGRQEWRQFVRVVGAIIGAQA